jgi:hypothetical protein
MVLSLKCKGKILDTSAISSHLQNPQFFTNECWHMFVQMGIGCRQEKGFRAVVLQTKNTFILSAMPNSWKKA